MHVPSWFRETLYFGDVLKPEYRPLARQIRVTKTAAPPDLETVAWTKMPTAADAPRKRRFTSARLMIPVAAVLTSVLLLFALTKAIFLPAAHTAGLRASTDVLLKQWLHWRWGY